MSDSIRAHFYSADIFRNHKQEGRTMTCYRADIAARRPLIAAVVSVQAFGLTQSVMTTAVHRLGMRPFTNSKRKNNRFPV